MTASAASTTVTPGARARTLGLRPTILLSLAIAAEIFSGSWTYLGIGLGLDRILLAAGLFFLVWGGGRAVSDRQLRLRPVHVVLLVAALVATCSAIAVGTLTEERGGFALLDRFGLVPFVLFAIAPLVFGTTRQRNILLAILVGVGAYLGVTVWAEGLGIRALVVPSFINDPNIGLHFGRARGPFVESVADGLSLFMCAVAAAVGLKTWVSRSARLVCGTVMLICGFGVILTLTRSVWLGAIAGTLAALLVWPAGRRWVLPAVLVGAVVVVAALQLVPGLEDKAKTRTYDQSTAWDRLNTNAAAIRMLEAKPLFGFGWQTFQEKGPDYLRQAADRPLSGAGNEVHNVFLSHAAELGLVGSLLWLAGLLGAVGGSIVRRGPPELAPWRVGLVAIFVSWFVVANLGPLSSPFPNLLLWTWAGIVGAHHLSRPRREARHDDAAPVRLDDGVESHAQGLDPTPRFTGASG